MLKARNIIIIFLLNYLILILVSAYFEIVSVRAKARTILETIQVAAEMSLDQTQAIDEFLTRETNPDEYYRLVAPAKNGNGFVQEDTYLAMFGIDTSVAGGKELAFRKMYDNDEFRAVGRSASVMKIPIKYWDSPAHNFFTWYYMPTPAVVGTELYSPNDIEAGGKLVIYDRFHNRLSDTGWSKKIQEAYGVDKITKLSDGKEYFNTPLSYGITYINKELVSRLFVNNMDLIMRYKYREENLNTPEGGNGVLRGQTFSDRITQANLDVANASNPINNGVFTFLRGPVANNGTSSAQAYEGTVAPDIEYKVIDIFDTSGKNEALLGYLYGFNLTDGAGDTFSTKRDLLYSADANRRNNAAQPPARWESKPVVVAKVTFYADVYVPYFTLTFREYASDVPTYSNNLIDLKKAGTNPDGSIRIKYTTFFAVTP